MLRLGKFRENITEFGFEFRVIDLREFGLQHFSEFLEIYLAIQIIRIEGFNLLSLLYTSASSLVQRLKMLLCYRFFNQPELLIELLSEMLQRFHVF